MAAQFRRHDLVWLNAAGWRHVSAGDHEPEVAECLAHWCRERLPLVVGRQDGASTELALGLAAPATWGRRKIALRVPRACVLYHDLFPRAAEVARLLPLALRPQWLALLGALAQREVDARVHGSFGWQRLTGLRYVRTESDLDLLLPVADAEVADAVAERLQAVSWAGPRLDGELVFPNGSAVAWREWLQWRAGAVQRVMVKRLHGVSLEQGQGWLEVRRVVAA